MHQRLYLSRYYLRIYCPGTRSLNSSRFIIDTVILKAFLLTVCMSRGPVSSWGGVLAAMSCTLLYCNEYAVFSQFPRTIETEIETK
jgi:hypothetical protein